jgi:hypothetical protein
MGKAPGGSPRERFCSRIAPSVLTVANERFSDGLRGGPDLPYPHLPVGVDGGKLAVVGAKSGRSGGATVVGEWTVGLAVGKAP